MKYLIFSKLNRNHFLFLSNFIIVIISEINNKLKRSITKDIVRLFHKNYIKTLSDFLSIIPIVIIKLRSKGISKNKSEQTIENKSQKNSKETDDEFSNSIEYIYTDMNIENNKKRSKIILKLIILTSIFEFLAIYIDVTFYIIVNGTLKLNKYQMNSSILFNVISKYVLSILILHSPVYRHHYLSLAINLICLIGLVIPDIIKIQEPKQYFYVLIKIISIISYSFEDTFAKILLSFNSISPYMYLLYRGICVNILSLMYSIIFIFVKIHDESGEKSCVFTRFWKVYDNKLNILFYFIEFFIHYLHQLNIFLIIDKFSIIHFVVGSILEYLAALLISTIFDGFDTKEFFTKIPVYLIIFVSALIYNEFIILNFCGLQKYTKLFLQKIAKHEINQTILNDIDDRDSILEKEMINMERNSTEIFRESNIDEYRSSSIQE